MERMTLITVYDTELTDAVAATSCDSIMAANEYIRGFNDGARAMRDSTKIRSWLLMPDRTLLPMTADKFDDGVERLQGLDTHWGRLFMDDGTLFVLDGLGDTVQEVITAGQMELANFDGFTTCTSKNNRFFSTKGRASSAWICAAMELRDASLLDIKIAAEVGDMELLENMCAEAAACAELMDASPRFLRELHDHPDVAMNMLRTFGEKGALSVAGSKTMRVILETKDAKVAAQAIQECPWIRDRRLELVATGILRDR